MEPQVSGNIIRHLADMVMVMLPDGSLQYVNPSMEKILGYRSEELLGRPIGWLMTDDAPQFFAAVRRLVTTGDFSRCDLILKSKDDERVPVSFSGSLIRDDQGNMTGIVVIARDLREIRALIGELTQAKVHLEEHVGQRTRDLERAYHNLQQTQVQMIQQEKLVSLGQLAAGVAHEINSPIGFVISNMKTLQGYAEDLQILLSKYGEVKAHVREMAAAAPWYQEIQSLEGKIDVPYVLDDLHRLVRESADGAHRIHKIVGDLMEFSHVDEADFQLSDIHRGLDSTLNILQGVVRSRVNIAREYGDIPKILCYPQELNQVFMNLIMNALQAIPEQGEIRIRTAREDDQVCIEIQDNGDGIPEEYLTKIFDPFFSTKPVGQGTGLGLAISYGIIRKHNGQIVVQSRVGEGTTFTVRIPAIVTM